MVEALLDKDSRRRRRNRNKTADELFHDYDGVMVLKFRSRKSLREGRRVMGHFHAYLGSMPPTPELAAGFLGQYAELKAATLYRYHAIIKGFMAWLGEPLDSKIKVPNALPRYIEGHEIEKLKAALAASKTHKRWIERNVLLVDLACKTGLRRAELSGLMAGDVNLQRGYLVVRQGKGLKDRVVDIAPSLQPRLDTYVRGKAPDELVFGLAPSTISDIITRAARRAGVDIHCHSLRHFFGNSLVDSGTDIEVVRRLMGHSSLTSTQKYLGRTDAQRKAAIERLDQGNQQLRHSEAFWTRGI